jgi:hypothetical protein
MLSISPNLFNDRVFGIPALVLEHRAASKRVASEPSMTQISKGSIEK